MGFVSVNELHSHGASLELTILWLFHWCLYCKLGSTQLRAEKVWELLKILAATNLPWHKCQLGTKSLNTFLILLWLVMGVLGSTPPLVSRQAWLTEIRLLVLYFSPLKLSGKPLLMCTRSANPGMSRSNSLRTPWDCSFSFWAHMVT